MAAIATDFEFRTFPDDRGHEVTHFECLRDINAAKRKAGGMAKRCNGPVDLAYSGDEPWEERYITTASPSEYHASGYRFERLA